MSAKSPLKKIAEQERENQKVARWILANLDQNGGAGSLQEIWARKVVRLDAAPRQ